MKKVIIVVPSLVTGGGEKVALSLAAYTDRLKYDVTLLSLFPKTGTILEQKADQFGVSVIYLNKKPGFDPRIIFAVNKVLKRIKPDVVHAHLHVVPYLLPGTTQRGIRRKYYTVHNVAERDAAGIHRLALKIAFRFCGYEPVAISDYCRKTASKLYKIPEGRIPCIYVAIDTDVFQKRSVLRKSTNLRFISVGRFAEQKNQKLLLNAFAKVAVRFPNVELELVGDGELRGDLENQRKVLGLADKVIMDGISSDVCTKLNQADIYVSSSDYEGLPQTIIEAMACGLPIITTKVGGCEDVVDNGVNGLLVDIGDTDGLANAMIRLAEDVQLRKSLGHASAELSKSYDIHHCVEEYEKLYSR